MAQGQSHQWERTNKRKADSSVAPSYWTSVNQNKSYHMKFYMNIKKLGFFFLLRRSSTLELTVQKCCEVSFHGHIRNTVEHNPELLLAEPAWEVGFS